MFKKSKICEVFNIHNNIKISQLPAEQWRIYGKYILHHNTIASPLPLLLERGEHRWRIELEDKAKVVPSVWWTESLPGYLFCTANAIGWTQPVYLEQMVELNQSIWNKRLNSDGLFGINDWTQPFVPSRCDDLCLVF